MLLPHICTSLASYLPSLYVIFIRILCWDKHYFESTDFGGGGEGGRSDEGDVVDIKLEFPEVHDLPSVNIASNEDSWDQCGTKIFLDLYFDPLF